MKKMGKGGMMKQAIREMMGKGDALPDLKNMDPAQLAEAQKMLQDPRGLGGQLGKAGLPGRSVGDVREEMMDTPADPVARAATLLNDHRASIDRLDAILVYTLAERFKHTQAVGRLKAEHDLPPSDPAREARQIERLERFAREADLDPEFAREIPDLRHFRSHQASRETCNPDGGIRQTRHKETTQWP